MNFKNLRRFSALELYEWRIHFCFSQKNSAKTKLMPSHYPLSPLSWVTLLSHRDQVLIAMTTSLANALETTLGIMRITLCLHMQIHLWLHQGRDFVHLSINLKRRLIVSHSHKAAVLELKSLYCFDIWYAPLHQCCQALVIFQSNHTTLHTYPTAFSCFVNESPVSVDYIIRSCEVSKSEYSYFRAIKSRHIPPTTSSLNTVLR